MEKREEMGIETVRGKARTRLAAMMRDLSVASKKKESLVRFLQEKFEVTAGSNDTIATLQAKAVKRIYEAVPPEPSDVMGFGKHSECTYAEVMLNSPGYCTWIKDTAAQNPTSSDYRLRRFASWLEENQSAGTGSSTTLTRAPSTRVPPNRVQGYPMGPRSPSPKPAKTQEDEKMALMMETLLSLKEEIAEMKGERTRKPRRATRPGGAMRMSRPAMPTPGRAAAPTASR